MLEYFFDLTYKFFVIGLYIVAVGFLVFGIDDIVFDVVYWSRALYRFITKRYPPLSLHELEENREQKISLFIPCWQEADVIEMMLTNTLESIYYRNYIAFVGVYPNDEETIEKIRKVKKKFPQLEMALNLKMGPTNKADNLNSMFRVMCEYEREHSCKFDIIVMQDAEDIIHPLSFKLHNHLIPRKEMVQIPVIPLEVPWYIWTHWVYNDEFAEIHSKTIVAREAIGGLVPAAGVGCAFSRDALETLAQESDKRAIFDTRVLTEDYSISLRLRNHGYKGILAQHKVKRIKLKKKWIFLGPLVPKEVNERVATRSFFPTRYRAAIKQRSRWITGITLQEWRFTKWHGDWRTKYSLIQDRKALISYFFTLIGYFVFFYFIIHYFWSYLKIPREPPPILIQRDSWIWTVMVIDLFLMLHRLLEKVIAMTRYYTFFQGLMSIPRSLYAGVMNFHSLMLAIGSFFLSIKQKKKLEWKKTSHTFPSEKLLKEYRQNLGDLLFQNEILSAHKIKRALKNQEKTHQKLGEILLENQDITQDQLIFFLGKLHHRDVITELPSYRDYTLLEQKLPEKYKELLENYIVPIQLKNETLTVATILPKDPSREKKIEKLYNEYPLEWCYLLPSLFVDITKKILQKNVSLPIGEMLVNARLITKEQVEEALEEQKRSSLRVGQIVVQKGWVKENDLLKMLAAQFGMEFGSLNEKILPEVKLLKALLGSTFLELIEEHLLPIDVSFNFATEEKWLNYYQKKLKEILGLSSITWHIMPHSDVEWNKVTHPTLQSLIPWKKYGLYHQPAFIKFEMTIATSVLVNKEKKAAIQEKLAHIHLNWKLISSNEFETALNHFLNL